MKWKIHRTRHDSSGVGIVQYTLSDKHTHTYSHSYTHKNQTPTATTITAAKSRGWFVCVLALVYLSRCTHTYKTLQPSCHQWRKVRGGGSPGHHSFNDSKEILVTSRPTFTKASIRHSSSSLKSEDRTKTSSVV